MAASPLSTEGSQPSFLALAADLLDPPKLASRWYCNQPGCDGEPHDRWYWCVHPLLCPVHGKAGAPKGETCPTCHDWTCRHAREAQRPPAEFVNGKARGLFWMMGRGGGKSRAAAEWTADQAKANPRSYWAVVAPTGDDVRDTCFEGESGLLQALGWDRSDDRYNKTRVRITLDNGAIIRSYSAETPRRVRGPNLWGAWLEEIAQWKYREMWDNLFPAIRRGLAQYVITSTPAPVPLVREFATRDDGSVIVVRGATFDNAKNLAPHQVEELKRRWAGTRRERQELYGELLEDVAGALWQTRTIETTRGVLLD